MNGWRHVNVRLRLLNALDGFAEQQRRCKVERNRDGRNESLVVDGKRCACRLVMSERTKRNNFAVIRGNVDVGQAVGALRILRLHFENNVILIEPLINIRDLSLTESVTERVVHVRKTDAEA